MQSRGRENELEGMGHGGEENTARVEERVNAEVKEREEREGKRGRKETEERRIGK